MINKLEVAIIFGLLIFISLVSFHSVQEIHYLKSFYPSTFTVEEAYYASVIELVKVFLISFPIGLAIVFYLVLIKRK